jgi:hypothetical protein
MAYPTDEQIREHAISYGKSSAGSKAGPRSFATWLEQDLVNEDRTSMRRASANQH